MKPIRRMFTSGIASLFAVGLLAAGGVAQASTRTTSWACTAGKNGSCGPYADSKISASENKFPAGNSGDGPTLVGNQVISGVSYKSTMGANSAEDWRATVKITRANDSGGEVVAFPSTQIDTYDNNNDSAAVPLTDFSDVISSYRSSMPAASTGVVAESGYDVWTNSWNGESMIWTDEENRLGSTPKRACGTGQPATSASPSDTYMGVVATDVKFGGSNGVPVKDWDLCVNGTPSAAAAVHDDTEYIWYLPGAQMNSGSVDIQAMIHYEINHGLLAAGSGYTQINYGFEICSTSGAQQFSLSKLTLKGDAPTS
jgi:hypothetical protein